MRYLTIHLYQFPLIQKELISKQIQRAEREYMNRHFPQSTLSYVLKTGLKRWKDEDIHNCVINSKK